MIDKTDPTLILFSGKTLFQLGGYMNSQNKRFPMLTYKLPLHDLVHVLQTLSATRIIRSPFF
jgi:hypothetical protein